jgi:HEPN domain-containing protein
VNRIHPIKQKIVKGMVDVACFETQQAIEFLIKAILLENGISYAKLHDIRYLLSLLEQVNFSFEKMDSLDLLTPTSRSYCLSSKCFIMYPIRWTRQAKGIA